MVLEKGEPYDICIIFRRREVSQMRVRCRDEGMYTLTLFFRDSPAPAVKLKED